MADTPELGACTGGVSTEEYERIGPPRLREGFPADGRQRWLITRYDDAIEVLSNLTLSSVLAYSDKTTEMAPGVRGDIMAGSFVGLDPPEHTRLRKLVVRDFSAKRIEELRPRMQQIANDLVDRAGPDADLLEEFAFPLPVTVIADILGVPEVYWGRFKALPLAMLGLADSAALTTLDEQRAVIAEIIAEKRRRPEADLISRLVDDTTEGKLDEDELITTVRMLFLAGHATTVHLIRNGVLTLVGNPDQLQRLRQDPTLVPKAVDELLRSVGSVRAVSRHTLEAVVIGGVTIPKDSMIDVSLVAANRDPGHYSDGAQLDVCREAADHLGFGHGIHYCVGARLTTVETEVAFHALIERPNPWL